MGSIISIAGTVFYSLLFLNSQQGFFGLRHIISVISVIAISPRVILKIGNIPVRGRPECDYSILGRTLGLQGLTPDGFLRPKIERFFWRDFSERNLGEAYLSTTLFPLIGCGVDSYIPELEHL